MLSKRQVEILADYARSDNTYIPASRMAQKHDISKRTLQSDNQAIRTYIANYGATLKSMPSKGTRLVVHDSQAFDAELSELFGMCDRPSGFSERSSRVVYLLRRLMGTQGFVPLTHLAHEMYISRTTLSVDITELRETAQRYNLAVETATGEGIRLTGSEVDIRRCIVHENIGALDDPSQVAANLQSMNTEYQELSRIVTESLSKHHFKVSDYVFQTILVHLEVSLERMRQDHYLEKTSPLDISYEHAFEVAREIMEACTQHYNLGYSENESWLLAVELQGKREVSEENFISKELTDFIFSALVAVRDQLGIDLTTDMSLRLSLALHTLPLITRARYNMQLENSISFDIKQNYVLAFDAATIYAKELKKVYGSKLTEGETSFLALHFLVSLMSHPYVDDSKRVLIISKERKSNTIIIQQKLKMWFPDSIQTIDVVGSTAIDSCDMSSYDVVLTTDATIARSTGAILIGLFLSDDEYNKVRLAISGFSRPQDLTDMFSREMFYTGPIATKEEAIRIVCNQTTVANAPSGQPSPNEIFDAVLEHEQYTNSFMGDLIAMPHPNSPITTTTFVSVAISDREIDWETKGNTDVRLVLLVCIERDNPAAYALWYSLSGLVSNRRYAERIIAEPTFENFIDVVADSFREE